MQALQYPDGWEAEANARRVPESDVVGVVLCATKPCAWSVPSIAVALDATRRLYDDAALYGRTVTLREPKKPKPRTAKKPASKKEPDIAALLADPETRAAIIAALYAGPDAPPYTPRAPKTKDGTRRKSTVPKTFTRATFDAMMDSCDRRYPTGRKNRAMLALMYDTGMRVGELCYLRVGDIDRERNEITVPVEGKTGSRTAILGSGIGLDYLYRVLDEWEQVRGERGSFYFATHKGTRLTPRSVERTVWGMNPTITPHMCRHSWATDKLRGDPERGIPPWPVAAVAQQLGHSSPAVTMRSYAHALTSELHELRDRQNK